MSGRRIAIIGWGYVGRGMERLFCDRFDVSVYDIEHQPDHSQVMGADLAVICVPTPESEDGSADVSAVEQSVALIDAPLIVIKSTVPPGTTDRLAAKYNKAVHFSPEYMGEPRNYVAPWRQPDPTDARSHSWVTVGGPKAHEVLEYFLAVMAVDVRYNATTALKAELAKYMENAYFATKVTFCNEFARICAAHDVPYMDVRELWLCDPRMEADHTAVFRDNPGYGGKCLPKDMAGIISASREAGYYPSFLAAVRDSNLRFRGQRP